ncbi:MAG: DUF4430 domain-containing protein [Candidatus Izemoplasmatales bacterium]|jgi:hypothetical protein
MKRKVLGTMLFLLILPVFFGCQSVTSETTSFEGQIIFQLYDQEGTKVSEKTVAYDETDTLLELLMENYTVYCQGQDGNPDESCSFEGQYGYYIMGIDTVTAFTGNAYIAFYINDAYAMTGIGDTPIVNGSVYQFKFETY